MAALSAFVFGAVNLGVPSLWHDELVHVVVAREFAATGHLALPSGVFYPSSMLYNTLLGASVAVFGDGAVAVRMPSVLFSVLNVLLTYAVARRLLGRNEALLAAFAMALSPWSVAWAREARLYALQATCYLCFLWTVWRTLGAQERGAAARWGSGAGLAYLGGMLCSFHSLLYIAGPGAYAVLRGLAGRRVKSRWALAVAVFGALGLLTLWILTVSYTHLTLPTN